MNPRDTASLMIDDVPANADIRTLAAPNYFRQARKIKGVLTICRYIATAALIYVILSVSWDAGSGYVAFMTGPIMNGADATGAPWYVAIPFAFLIASGFFGIIKLLNETKIGRRLIRYIATLFAGVGRFFQFGAGARILGRAIDRFVPAKVSQKFEGISDRILDLVMPRESRDLDPDILAILPQSRYKWLYADIPADIHVSPLLDGRLPDGSMPARLIGRLHSRTLWAVAIKKTFIPIVILLSIAVVLDIANIFPSTINAARQWVYNEHESDFNAQIAADTAKYQAAYPALEAAWQAKRQQIDQQNQSIQAAAQEKQQADLRAAEQTYQQGQANYDKQMEIVQRWQFTPAGQLATQNYDREIESWYKEGQAEGLPQPQPPHGPPPPAPPPGYVQPVETAPVLLSYPPEPATQYTPPDDTWTAPSPLLALSFHGVVLLDIFVLTICLFVLSTAPPTVIRRAEEIYGAKYLIQTKAALVKWSADASRRRTFLRSYSRQIELCNGWLAASKLLYIGKATGILAEAGDYGPKPGTNLALDSESLGFGVKLFGGIGEGKTTGVLVKSARQIMAWKTTDLHGAPRPSHGLICFDAKGVFGHVLKRVAEQIGRGDDVVLVGPGYATPNPLLGLTPANFQAQATSVMNSDGESSDPVWIKSAATTLLHCAAIAQAIGRYTPRAIYDIASSPEIAQAAVIYAGDFMPEERKARFPGLNAAIKYLATQWHPMQEATKRSILMNITNLLDGACSDPTLAGFVGEGLEIDAYGNLVYFEPQDLDDTSIINAVMGGEEHEEVAGVKVIKDRPGKIVLVVMSSTAGGIGGQLIIKCLKAGLFGAARTRQEKFGAAYCRRFPVEVMIDEAQEVVSGGEGYSDASFAAVCREAGFGLYYATQSISSYVLKIGEAETTNLLGNLRTTLMMRCEDERGQAEIIRVGAEYLRCNVFEQGQYESIERWESQHNQPYIGDAEAEQAAMVQYVSNASVREAMSIQTDPDDTLNPKAIYTSRLTPETARYLPDRAYAEMNRVEDKNLSFLTQNNSVEAAIRKGDIGDWGRFHMLAKIQRAGGERLDVLIVEHDFT